MRQHNLCKGSKFKKKIVWVNNKHKAFTNIDFFIVLVTDKSVGLKKLTFAYFCILNAVIFLFFYYKYSNLLKNPFLPRQISLSYISPLSYIIFFYLVHVLFLSSLHLFFFFFKKIFLLFIIYICLTYFCKFFGYFLLSVYFSIF